MSVPTEQRVGTGGATLIQATSEPRWMALLRPVRRF